MLGALLGDLLGAQVGKSVARMVGARDGSHVGSSVGSEVGKKVGKVGALGVGEAVGAMVGEVLFMHRQTTGSTMAQLAAVELLNSVVLLGSPMPHAENCPPWSAKDQYGCATTAATSSVLSKVEKRNEGVMSVSLAQPRKGRHVV